MSEMDAAAVSRLTELADDLDGWPTEQQSCHLVDLAERCAVAVKAIALAGWLRREMLAADDLTSLRPGEVRVTATPESELRRRRPITRLVRALESIGRVENAEQLWVRAEDRDEIRRAAGEYQSAAIERQHEEPTAAKQPPQDNSVQAVRARLLQLVDQGEPYSSERKLGQLLACSAGTINTAINGNKRLLNWRAGQKHNATEAVSLGTRQAVQTAELSPDDAAAVAEMRDAPAMMEQQLQRLRAEISRLPETKRKEQLDRLREIEANGNPALLAVWAEQLRDDRQHAIKPKQRI